VRRLPIINVERVEIGKIMREIAISVDIGCETACLVGDVLVVELVFAGVVEGRSEEICVFQIHKCKSNYEAINVYS